ncbi:hypothetical protein [Fusibacter sp. 3D3]|uniref:hypothetical protein n=1 Tax=Fusibacter sp. 3D3 TaxID=1048380 RepID=UPI000853B343|nr:hypothetical protein [Fusibacter sp. 3D3]GAU76007.1 hypothetical protein F3D3_0603 [Fusibacter sp. 3D3]
MKSWRNKKKDHPNRESLSDRHTKWITAELIPLPEEVKNWMSQLILLKEVPLAYLVVDEREMPVESIRFFNVDPHWAQALVDGAFSIGALTQYEAVQSIEHLPRRYENAKASVRLSRYERMHSNHKPQNMRMTTEVQTPLSGFIMRSDLVSNWKAIEVKGFMGETQRDILRMETLSDKVLICIFEGEVDAVRMYEPKEVLHFGTRSQDRKIDVRRIDEGHEGEPLYQQGTEVKVTVTVPVADNGRLKVTELRETLSRALNTTTNEMDSPQLALEMLSVAGQCVFERGQ